MFLACLVFMGVGGESLGSESNCITPACPRDVANLRVVSPLRSGMLGLRSFRSNNNYYFLMSTHSSIQEWCSTIKGIRSVGIDILLF